MTDLDATTVPESPIVYILGDAGRDEVFEFTQDPDCSTAISYTQSGSLPDNVSFSDTKFVIGSSVDFSTKGAYGPITV